MLEEASHKKSGKYLTTLHKIIDSAKKTCVEKLATWYARIAKNNDVSMAEAKKMLTASELSEFRWDVKEYVKKAEENELNGKWVKQLENASAKAHISRYDALMLELRAAEEQMYTDYVGTVRECLEDVYEDSYLHGIYELGVKTNNVGAFQNVYVDRNKLDKILRNPWAGDDKIFSDRIWQKKEQLVQDLQTELARNIALGKPPGDTIDYIEKKHNVTKKQAQNLVETETAFVHEAAQQDVYEDLDSEQYEILAVLDFKTSKICQEMDGKIFDTKDFLVGTTAPPFHPRCRTTTVPYDELWDGDQDEPRSYRGPDGKTYWTDSHLTYKEWMEQYVNVDSNFKKDYDFKRKSNENRSADKKQFDKYQEILGAKNAPKTLEEFQKMKYTNGNKWEDLKKVYKETSWQKKALEKHSTGEEHTSPYQSEPNSVYDNYKNGVLVQRRYYGKTGKPRLDIDMTDHGNSKQHPVVPHYHDWNENKNKKLVRDSSHDNGLKTWHKIANKDILKE